MMTEIKRPEDCSDAELALFKGFILQGSEIESPQLMGKIKQAHKLIFILENSDPVAVSALRYSTMDYCKDIFHRAGVPQLLENYAFEVSWAYTTEASRGRNYGHLLMETAIEQANGKGCFATARANNKAAHAIFQRYGLERLGNSYSSERGDYTLELFGQEKR